MRSVTFVTHVHPDPDGLGSMMGLAHLVESCLGKPTRLTRDGVISRAENRAMVELLDLDLQSVDQLGWECGGDAIVMVDSQPKTGRHNLDPEDWLAELGIVYGRHGVLETGETEEAALEVSDAAWLVTSDDAVVATAD